MRLPLRHLLVPIVLGAGLLPAGAGEPVGRPGEIELSDGTVLRGLVRFTEGRDLRLQTQGGQTRTHRIPPEAVSVLEMRVAAERMERPWRFENPGDPTKTYEEGEYPLRDLDCVIRRVDGGVLGGALLSTPVYVRPEGAEAETRFSLVRQQKGKVGETLDDLVFVRFVRFDGEAAPFRVATIRGRFEADDRLEAVAALHRESGRVHPGEVLDASAGTFVVRGLPGGTFDLFLQSEEAFGHGLAPLAADRPGGDGGLALEDLEAVRAATTQAPGFFEARQVVALSGTHAAARALVVQDRVGKTSYESELRGATPWRVDVWLWHRLETEWRLDRRLYVFRGTRAPDEIARRPRFVEGLGGISVEPGGTLDLGVLSRGADR